MDRRRYLRHWNSGIRIPDRTFVASMYVTYGVMQGFGQGLIYTVIISTVQKWFPEERDSHQVWS